MSRVGVATAGAVALLVGSAGGAPASAATERDRSRAEVLRCLRAHGARTTAVPRSDPSLRSLHDLAQRTSFLARVGVSRVGVAVTANDAKARLLVELLTLPRSGYLVRRHGNAVLLFRSSDRRAARVAAACLGG